MQVSLTTPLRKSLQTKTWTTAIRRMTSRVKPPPRFNPSRPINLKDCAENNFLPKSIDKPMKLMEKENMVSSRIIVNLFFYPMIVVSLITFYYRNYDEYRELRDPIKGQPDYKGKK